MPPDAASSLIAELNSISGQAPPSAEVAQVTPPPPVEAAPAQPQQPQTSDQPAQAPLPQTASPYPLIGLAGLAVIGLYAGLRLKFLS